MQSDAVRLVIMHRPCEISPWLDRLQGASSDSISWRCIADFAEQTGFKRICFHPRPSPGGRDKLRHEGFPSKFIGSYLKLGLDSNNPLISTALRHSKPTLTKDYFCSVQSRDLQSIRLRNLLIENQIEGGTVLPVFGPLGQSGVLSWGGGPEYQCLPRPLRNAVACISQAYYLRLVDMNAKDLPTLSPREQEVLALVAAGHTNCEIAAAVRVSTHTVQTYLRRIFIKLNVTNRAAAAMCGLLKGLVA